MDEYDYEGDSIYSDECRERLLDDGEIDIFEEAFMRGYEEAV